MPSTRVIVPLTWEGLFWLGISVAMFVTALLKGINLVTLLASCLMTAVPLNYYWASRQLRKVQARRLLTEPAFAGTPCSVHVRLENTARTRVFGIGIREERAENRQAGFLAQLAPRAVATLAYRLLFP